MKLFNAGLHSESYILTQLYLLKVKLSFMSHLGKTQSVFSRSIFCENCLSSASNFILKHIANAVNFNMLVLCQYCVHATTNTNLVISN